jgi:cytochrome c
MFDTMTVTKAFGAVCGTFLIYLLGAWAAESIYGHGEGGHGEEMAQAYSVDTGAEEPAAAEGGDAGPDFATLLASADPAAGEKVFAKCKSCHKVDGTNGTGPHLNGVVGRPKASIAEFTGYSDAIKALSAEAWEPEKLNGFLQSPKDYMPGTKMGFAGLPKAEDRANVIAYLATTAP